MASPTQNQLSNADLFDAYFRRADLDRDGRISGAEAVSFFQGSGLPKQVLAQIWTIANQSQSGFLGRPEFYNALKLVTVAQSKRDLTPEIVKAALYSPASAKIPVPQMNFSAVPTQNNASAAGPVQTLSPATSTSTPSFGFRGAEGPMTMSGGVLPVRSNEIGTQHNQSMVPSQMQPASSSLSISGGIASLGQSQNVTAGPQSQVMRPSQMQSPPSASLSAFGASTQGFGGVSPSGGAHNDWISGKTTAAPAGAPSLVQGGGISPSSTQDEFRPVNHGSVSALRPGPQSPSALHPSGQGVKDSNTWGTSGNGVSSDPFFGGDVFSAVPSKPTKDTSLHTSSAHTLPSSTSSTAAPPSLAGTALPSSLRPVGPVSLPSSFPSQPANALYQQSSTHAPVIPRSSGMSIGSQSLGASPPQRPWPKMTQTDINKYTKVFFEVDKDRDGKITGEQARNLFLSWRLPREVLKQVWDLSDQDNDSMLSLKEFCIALYLMERHREGSPLPPVLPSSIMFDLSNIGQSVTQHRNGAWEPASGFQQQQQQQQQWMPVSGDRQLDPAVVRKPPRPPSTSHSEEVPLTNQQKTKVPVLENLVNQLSSDEQDSLKSKLKEATEAAKKVEELEKDIMDSNEKMQFYRTKMQELVLYKSRCDNRLNEIIERISADKHEVESLAKKYEDKYKQTGDVASKLTAEEATFRDIQDKKMELYQSILKMENDGNTDGELQAHADHIQSALDELIKSMNERCKKYGLRAKPMTLVELPFGWQPGIQEGAADWDEDWDKFQDEGFSFVKELTLEVQNTLAPPKKKLQSAKTDEATITENAVSASSPKASDESEKLQSKEELEIESGRLHDKVEDASTRTAPNSPIARSADENPSSKVPDSHVEKISTLDTLLNDKESESNQADLETAFSGEKNYDDSNWGNFDASDDVDSVWGFNYASTGKEIAQERNGNNYFYDPGDFGLNPIKTGSHQTADFSQKRGGFAFDESVPSTPLSIFGNSPKRSGDLNPIKTGSHQTAEFSQKRGGFTFDDSVPSTPLSIFGNSPKRSSDFSEAAFDNFTRFDSFNKDDNVFFPSRDASVKFDSLPSSKDFDYSHRFPSFDDSDPFGSGPFKTSLDSQNPRKTWCMERFQVQSPSFLCLFFILEL